MTATLDQVDTSAIDALDFEKTCEVRYVWFMDGKPTGDEVGCGRPARWLGNYPCCGHLSILCHEHAQPDEATFHCNPCNRNFGAEALVNVRPLK